MNNLEYEKVLAIFQTLDSLIKHRGSRLIFEIDRLHDYYEKVVLNFKTHVECDYEPQ